MDSYLRGANLLQTIPYKGKSLIQGNPLYKESMYKQASLTKGGQAAEFSRPGNLSRVNSRCRVEICGDLP